MEAIAEARCLDVISLGTDQNAQEHFFRPEEMDPDEHGAGGVPVRTPDDLRAIYQASRRGNYPLMRSYSGTRDHLQYADMLVRTINNAWCATSLFWFNAMDVLLCCARRVRTVKSGRECWYKGSSNALLEAVNSHHTSTVLQKNRRCPVAHTTEYSPS